MTDRFLPGVPGRQIEEIFNAAPGNEIESGNFDSRESSAALVANTFGFFLNRAYDLPSLPGCAKEICPATSLGLERTVRYPWSGGSHPVLDVLIATPSALIGIEAKRFEPFRDEPQVSFTEAHWRPVWGDCMKAYERVRDKLYGNVSLYTSLKADQLVKHAFGLRTQTRPNKEFEGLTPILFYLYAEPDFLPNVGKPIDEYTKAQHREEVEDFAEAVAGDEVRFISCRYRELLADWELNSSHKIRLHAQNIIRRFSP